MIALLLGLAACSLYPPGNDARDDASKKIANSSAAGTAATAPERAPSTATAPKSAPDNLSANPAPHAPAAAPPAAPVAPVPFEQAVDRAGQKLLKAAHEALGDAPRVLVIDPLIDANSGQQSSGTVQMEEILKRIVQSTFPGMAIYPLKRSSLEQGPILLMGTLTPVNTANANDQGSNAFRIWLTVVDLRTGRIIAKALDRATVETVNSNPLSYYRDSPTWHKDRTTAAYINSCQANSKVGDFVDPTYLMRLPKPRKFASARS